MFSFNLYGISFLIFKYHAITKYERTDIMCAHVYVTLYYFHKLTINTIIVSAKRTQSCSLKQFERQTVPLD